MERLLFYGKEEYSSSFSIFEKISKWINDYGTENPREMLPKPPRLLYEIYNEGLSWIAFNSNDEPIGHVALYPLLNVNDNRRGKIISLMELGSLIVDPRYRNFRIDNSSLTIGEQLIVKILKKFPDNPTIATVKRSNTLRAMTKPEIGGEVLDFNEFPCVAALTCVCPNSSEHYGYSSCSSRRGNGDSTVVLNPDNYHNYNNSGPSLIPCTLVGFNQEELMEFERILQEQIFPGEEGVALSPESFSTIKDYFSKKGINIL